MADQWFYARSGQQSGPVNFDQLVHLARTGGLTSDDLVWKEGTPDWQIAGQVTGLFASPAGPHVPSPPAAAPFQTGGPVPVRPIQYAGPYQPPQQIYPPGAVPNYLVQAILVTVLCCLPFGIVAIVYAAQVNGKLAAGDYDGAVLASKNAKMWSWIAFGVYAALVGVYMLVMLVAALAR